MTRVLFVASRLSEPSCRFRFLQYLPYLNARSIETQVLDIGTTNVNRFAQLSEAREFDAVLVHRVLFRWLEFFRLRRLVPSYVFDFDDAIFLRDSMQRGGFQSAGRASRFRRMVRHARRAIAGNGYLQAEAARHNPDTVLLPTTIDLAPYAGWESDRRARPVVGWIGTRSTSPYLATIAPALAKLGARPSPPLLKIVCDAFPDMPGIEVERKVWRLEEEAGDVRSFQVGLMPLPDDAWTRGKCGLKLLQYMAAGIPVVCSPTGANREIVQEGVTGYFAETSGEWVDRIARLLADPAERRRMGEAGRRRVETLYSTEASVDRYIEAICAPSREAQG